MPMHPRPGAGPDEVRWVLDVGALPARGVVTAAPAALQALLADGTLAEVRVDHEGVLTRAAAGRDWQTIGAAVRSALTAALREPDGWATAEVDNSGADARIAAAARCLLDGELGSYARGHGGEIALVEVRDGVAAIRLRGACRGCPASETTLRERFEKRLREQCPELVGVRDAS